MTGNDWTTRDALTQDATYVWDNLWEQGQIELEGFGVSREKWVAVCAGMIASHKCVVFERNGEVQCLLGVNKDQTWFQAVKGADMLGLTKHMARAIPELMKRVHGAAPSIYSLCVIETAARWFKTLGFVEDTNYRGHVYGGRVERRFVPGKG